MKEAILKQFFAPIKARFRLLLILPALNLLVLAIVLLFLKSPKEAILIAMGGISFTVFLIGSKKFVSLFYYSSLIFNLMIFFVTWEGESPWSKVWSISMMISLTIGYFLSREVLEFFYKEEKLSKENEAEKGLWKNRFETARDAHNLETLNLEEELSRSLEGFTEKNKQIEALERLVEVIHKEAGILSKQKHELLDKVRCQGDSRNDEEIKKQNLALQKEIARLSTVERDLVILKEEKESFSEEISALQEENRSLQKDSENALAALKKEMADLEQKRVVNSETKGYGADEIFKMLQNLQFFRTEKKSLELVVSELREKLNVQAKPFKWQVWKGDKKEKKPQESAKISMMDLGKGLKI